MLLLSSEIDQSFNFKLERLELKLYLLTRKEKLRAWNKRRSLCQIHKFVRFDCQKNNFWVPSLPKKEKVFKTKQLVQRKATISSHELLISRACSWSLDVAEDSRRVFEQAATADSLARPSFVERHAGKWSHHLFAPRENRSGTTRELARGLLESLRSQTYNEENPRDDRA